MERRCILKQSTETQSFTDNVFIGPKANKDTSWVCCGRRVRNTLNQKSKAPTALRLELRCLQTQNMMKIPRDTVAEEEIGTHEMELGNVKFQEGKINSN